TAPRATWLRRRFHLRESPVGPGRRLRSRAPRASARRPRARCPPRSVPPPRRETHVDPVAPEQVHCVVLEQPVERRAVVQLHTDPQQPELRSTVVAALYGRRMELLSRERGRERERRQCRPHCAIHAGPASPPPAPAPSDGARLPRVAARP